MDNNSVLSKAPTQSISGQVRSAIYLAQRRQVEQEVQDIAEKSNILQTRMEINSLLLPLITQKPPATC